MTNIAKLYKVENETKTTKRFYFEAINLNKLDFHPGQFISFEFPIDEKQSKRIRHYSIANAPDNSNKFEIIIVKKDGGKGTDWLWKQDIGVEIPFTGPSGIMIMDEDKNKNHIFICTGTGISPFRSMLLDIKNKNVETGDLILIFGTRDKESMLYYQEMKELETSLENMTYLPILSREEINGRKGYVHLLYKEVVDNYFKQMEKGSYNDLDVCFYICGWKDMVKEARTNLLNLGFDKKQIKQEIYE
jgi:CDP-4-dehydro-6-deoxyglucose reductase